MPEQYDEKPQVQQVAQIINVCSASYWQLSRRAWLTGTRTTERNPPPVGAGFPGKRDHHMEQVNAGMRVARRQNRPFLPHPGSLLHGAGKKHPLSPDCQRQRAG